MIDALMFQQKCFECHITSFFVLDFQPPRFSFYDAAKPMFTSRRNLPPTAIDNSKVKVYLDF